MIGSILLESRCRSATPAALTALSKDTCLPAVKASAAGVVSG
jgi:hypothetical protein